MRVIRYNVAPKGFRTSSVTLVTTVLDASITAQELAALYLQRWGIELHFRELKTFLHMDVLRCKTPHMIERELAMHFVAYNLVRCVMQKAAITFDVELARVSFKGCLDTVRQFANAAQGAENKPKTVAALLDEMLLAIATRSPSPSPRSKRAASRQATPQKLPATHQTASPNGQPAPPKQSQSQKS